LAKRLVEMHGGTIEATSPGLGQGTTFAVRLPILADALPAGPATPEGDAVSPRARRILVVDDNRDHADSLEMLLALRGNTVRTAYEGAEGVRVAEEFRPDVILLDLGLPDIDGCEACRRIRARAWGDTPLVVALTGWGQPDDRQRTREAGFDHHLVKPIEVAALMTLLSE
jgi:CheY-like chemotaxis protein